MFAGHDVQTERLMLTTEDDDYEESTARLESQLGPLVMARAALEPQGKWEAAKRDLDALFLEANERELPAVRTSAEYLLTTVRPG